MYGIIPTKTTKAAEENYTEDYLEAPSKIDFGRAIKNDI